MFLFSELNKLQARIPGLKLSGDGQKGIPDGTVSKVTIIPFYDRTKLINETLDTLNTALTEEILVTIIVVILMLLNLRSSFLIAGLLPLAVLMSFIAMKYFKVDANIVALSGIAIAIGTMVDMGIVFVENINRHLNTADPDENRLHVIFRASSEVGSAVVTAVLTTIISFLPVFTMVAAEGKLFKPLAFTKTFALASSIIVAIMIIPPVAHMIFRQKKKKKTINYLFPISILLAGIGVTIFVSWWAGLIVMMVVGYKILEKKLSPVAKKYFSKSVNYLSVIVIGIILTRYWLPLGPESGLIKNLIFVAALIGGLLFLFSLFLKNYTKLLKITLNHRKIFFSIVASLVLLGAMSWLGFNAFFGWLPNFVKSSAPVSYISHKFPGLGKEFMPPLDEGSFLYMPTTMVHASIGEAMDVLSKQDLRDLEDLGGTPGILAR